MGGTISRDQNIAYLLGELSPEEQLRVEREYFSDNDAYDRLLAAEDELAYDYVEGRLSAGQRRHFESTIGATDRGRRNVEFARTLLDVLKTSEVESRPPARYWLLAAAAAVVLAVLPAWLAWRVAGLSGEVTRLRSEAAVQVVHTSPPPAPAAPAMKLAFLLTPGRSRAAGDSAVLEIPAEASSIRFELTPPPGATGGDFAVAIRSTSGAEVFSHAASFSGVAWGIEAPAGVFQSGSYELTIRRLAGGEQPPPLATYFFRTRR